MGNKQGKGVKGTLAAVPVTGNREQLEKEERQRKKEEEKMRKKGITPPKPEGPTEVDLMEALKAIVTKHDVDPNKYFTDLVVLGQGASGTVYSAKDTRTGKTVAIKQMIIGKRVEREVLINEISIMKEGMGCDDVVQYYESYIVFAQNLRDEDKLWVVMELVSGASMAEILSVCGAMEEPIIALVSLHVLRGLLHFHTRTPPIIHRDVKSDNLLIGFDGGIKIADFGFCCRKGGGDDSARVGTTNWMAPEVIKGKTYDCNADVWGVGITALEMFEANPPYYELSPSKAQFMIGSKGRPPYKNPDAMSEQLKDFIEKCTIMDPAQRPTTEQMLNHPFLQMAGDLSQLTPLVQKASENVERKHNMLLEL